MKEYVTEKNQLENLKQFKNIIPITGVGIAIINLSLKLNQNIEVMKNIVIDNKKITEYELYKTHCPIFKEIAEKTINSFDLLGVFGFSDDEILGLKEKTLNKNTVSQIFSDKLGISINEKIKDKDKKEIEILQKLSDKITPNINKKLVECMYFSNVEINKIINGVTDYMKIDLKNKSSKDDKLKEYLSLKLYADVFEIYLKVLKEIYSKFEKVKIENINNSKMYDFFNTNYPILLNSTNNKLRNDVCHLNYNERGNYTVEQIDEERSIILVKTVTGILVRNIFFVDSLMGLQKLRK